MWLQLWMRCNEGLQRLVVICSPWLTPPTTVCISEHGHDGELLVFALDSQQVPLPPQLLQRGANLHLSFLQQPLLDFVQSLTYREPTTDLELPFYFGVALHADYHSAGYLNLRCIWNLHPAGPSL